MSIWSDIESDLKEKNIEKATKVVKDFLLKSSAVDKDTLEEFFENDLEEIHLAAQELITENKSTKKLIISVRNFTDVLTPWAFKISASVPDLVSDSSEDFDEILPSFESSIESDHERMIALEGMVKTKRAISKYFSEYALDTTNLVAKHEFEALGLLTLLKFAKLIKKSLKTNKLDQRVKIEILEEDNYYLKLHL